MSETTFSILIGQGVEQDIADRRIVAFSKRFQKEHLYLAQHAAFPLALTPELLYGLWLNFRDATKPAIPWIAVADLLLSPLCTEIGYELYEIDVTIRAQLLKNLKKQFGEPRLKKLSQFMLQYIEKHLTNSNPRVRSLAETQQWIAYSYVQPDKAASKLAEKLRSSIAKTDKAENIRLASIAEMLEEQLQGFLPLVAYAKGTAFQALNNESAAQAEFKKITTQDIATLERLGIYFSPVIDEPKPNPVPDNPITPVEIIQSEKLATAAMIDLDEPPKAPIEPYPMPIPIKVSTTQTIRKQLFVVTAGTAAANVGRELLRQVNAHPQSEMLARIHAFDTAHFKQDDDGGGLWTQFQIRTDQTNLPEPQQGHSPQHIPDDFLYKNLTPSAAGGAGGSRYNSAAAVVANGDQIRQGFRNHIAALAQQGEGKVPLSFAIVASASGATGSGSLTYLLEILTEVASSSPMNKPVNCNIYLMLPDPEQADNLSQANTFALFAELAATRLSQIKLHTKSFQGRIILVGWGNTHILGSIEQLEKTTATLIRLTNDPASDLAEVYEEDRINSHILDLTNSLTSLPTHLSLATPITISLGNLEEQIVQRDTARFITNLVFRHEKRVAHRDANPFREILDEYMRGNTPASRLTKLNQYLERNIDLHVKKSDKVLQDEAMRKPDPKLWLNTCWITDQRTIDQSKQIIEDEGDTLVSKLTGRWQERVRREISTSSAFSLASLNDCYQELEESLEEMLIIARKDIPILASKEQVDQALNNLTINPAIKKRSGELSKDENNRGRSALIQSAISKIKDNIEEYLNKKNNATTIKVLQDLLDVVKPLRIDSGIALSRFTRERERTEIASTRHFSLASDSMLEIMALSGQRASEQEKTIERYYKQVSPIMEQHSYLEFRKWLVGSPEQFEYVLQGNVELLQHTIRDYVQKKVSEQVMKNSVLDLILQNDSSTVANQPRQLDPVSPVLDLFRHNDNPTLKDILQKAASEAQTLVPFNRFNADRLREKRYVCAYLGNDTKNKKKLNEAIEKTFGRGRCTLLESKDPTEIVVFYSVDGLSMANIRDVTEHSFDAFLNQRRKWITQRNSASFAPPVFSSNSAEKEVLIYDIIHKFNLETTRNLAPYRELPEV